MKRWSDDAERNTDAKRKWRDGENEATGSSLSESSEFTVHPRKYAGNFPYFRQPKEISCFSLDDQRKFHHNRSQLKIYIPPPNVRDVAFDLRAGYDIFIRRDETKKEYLDELLRCVLLSTDKFRPSTAASEQNDVGMSLFTDFICWRGLLTRLLCTPYENREGWEIGVTLFNKTLYLCEFETEDKKKMLADQSDRQVEMTYWGYKFEQYVTAPDGSDSKPDTTSPVNNNAAYCSLVRTRLEQHSLVYGGEVDCYEANEGKHRYIELKTSREIETPNQNKNFKKFKLIKWWAQSFLIGIEKVVCGFRNDDGVVQRLEDFKTSDMAKMSKEVEHGWEPSVCFNFVNQFLAHVKRTVTEDNSRVVYLFSWSPRTTIQSRKLDVNSEFCFLPEWYCSAIDGVFGKNT